MFKILSLFENWKYDSRDLGETTKGGWRFKDDSGDRMWVANDREMENVYFIELSKAHKM